jgi:S1-C subfamily serine protease
MGRLQFSFPNCSQSTDSIIIPAKVVFLHPTHNFAFLQYDPKLIGDTPVNCAVLSDVELGQGHHVNLVAFNHNHRPICVETVVTDVSAVTIPQSATPRFRAVNFDAMTLDTPLAQQCSSGVLADKDGLVQGIWLSFVGERTSNGHDNEYHLGIQIDRIKEVAAALKRGEQPKLRGLTVEVMPVPIAQARHMGLTEEWVSKVEAANPYRRQVFLVRRVETGTATASALKELDMILSISGNTITKVTELDVSSGWKESVEMVIIRKKEVMTLTVPTTEVDGDGTKECVSWAGVLLQGGFDDGFDDPKSEPFTFDFDPQSPTKRSSNNPSTSHPASMSLPAPRGLLGTCTASCPRNGLPTSTESGLPPWASSWLPSRTSRTTVMCGSRR